MAEKEFTPDLTIIRIEQGRGSQPARNVERCDRVNRDAVTTDDNPEADGAIDRL